jgi:protein TonB
MLAYAANRPRIGARQSSPNAMLFVICGHIVLIAAVMSAKMVLPSRVKEPPTTIIPVSIQKPPPPNPVQPTHPTAHDQIRYPQPQPQQPTFTATEEPWITPIDTGPVAQPNPVPQPPTPTPLQPIGETRGAQLVTPPQELRPPYPQAKLLAEEEATLRLRLAIDEQGRVVAVDPVGRADAIFLAAARRHLLAHWRYKPAMKDGRAVPSSITITLRFELDG